MKHVCVFCGRAMFTSKIGIAAIEYQDLAKTVPYRLWRVDLMECGSCPNKTLSFADKATETFSTEFEREVEVAKKSEDTVHFY